jgi:hypothetical protein
MVYKCDVCNIEIKKNYTSTINIHNNSAKHLFNSNVKTIGFVYKYTYKENEYIGSTFNIVNRKIQHEHDCFDIKRKQYNFPFYKFIRSNNLLFNDFYFEIIEEIECNNINELKNHEQNYMDIIKPNLNLQNAYGTDRALADAKRRCSEKYKNRVKEYLIKNKDKISMRNRETSKQNYELNRDEILKRNKEYRNKNRYKVLEQKKEYGKQNAKCDICNKEMRKVSIRKHKERKH